MKDFEVAPQPGPYIFGTYLWYIFEKNVSAYGFGSLSGFIKIIGAAHFELNNLFRVAVKNQLNQISARAFTKYPILLENSSLNYETKLYNQLKMS